MCHAKAGTEHIPPSILLDQTPMRRRPGTRHIPARVQKLKAGKRLRLGAKRKTPPSSRTGLQVDPLRHLKSPASPTVSQLGSRDVGKFRRRLHSDLINVRFGPLCGLKPDISRGPRSAKSGCEQMRQMTRRLCAYSITSSARARRDGGMVRPSALAVVKLMMRSNLVGCSTGMSPGLAPRMILST